MIKYTIVELDKQAYFFVFNQILTRIKAATFKREQNWVWEGTKIFIGMIRVLFWVKVLSLISCFLQFLSHLALLPSFCQRKALVCLAFFSGSVANFDQFYIHFS